MKKVKSKVSNYLRNMDGITKSVRSKVHFNNDTETLTVCGGFLTLLAMGYVLYVALSQGVAMINNQAPYILMTEKSLASNDPLIMQPRSFKELNKITFYFSDYLMKD